MIINWRDGVWPPVYNGVELLYCYVIDANGQRTPACWYLDTETGECRFDARNEWGDVIIDWDSGCVLYDTIYMEPPFIMYSMEGLFDPFCLP